MTLNDLLTHYVGTDITRERENALAIRKQEHFDRVGLLADAHSMRLQLKTISR